MVMMAMAFFMAVLMIVTAIRAVHVTFFLVVMVAVVMPVIVLAGRLTVAPGIRVFGRQEIRVQFQHGVQVETANIEDLANGYLPHVHGAYGGARIHAHQPVAQ